MRFLLRSFLSIFAAAVFGLLAGPLVAAEGTGLVVTFFENEDLTGASATRIEPVVNMRFADGVSPAPAAFTDGYWWSDVWSGVIDIPATDTYTFSTVSDDGVILLIDGKAVIDNWTQHGTTTDVGTLSLTAGRHAIQIKHFETFGGPTLQLWWASSTIGKQLVPQRVLYPELPVAVVGTGTGLSATYYDEDQFGGFTATKLEKNLNLTWPVGAAPAQSIAPDAWSVKWVGEIQAQYSETYTISALTNHPFSLAINGMQVIDDSADGVERTAVGKVYLKAGQRYELLATYRATSSPSRLAVSWSCPLTGRVSIPSTQLYPTSERQATKLELLSPMTTYTSPAWIEGSVGHWTTAVAASVNGVAVPVVSANASTWYLNTLANDKPPGIPLESTLSLLSINAVNGKSKQTMLRPILWKTLNIASLPYGMDSLDVRPGDTLRLTATGKGRAVAIDVDNVAGAAFSPEFTGRPGQVFAATFANPGIYQVLAQIDGKPIAKFTVRVPSVDLRGPIACHIDYTRIKDIGLTGNGAYVTLQANDHGMMDLEQVPTATAGEARLTLRPLNSGNIALQARLGRVGPLLMSCPVDEFTIHTTAEKTMQLVGVFPDGKMLLEAQLIMAPWIPGLDVRMSTYTAAITFEDSSVATSVPSDAFEAKGDGSGNYVYRLIRMGNAALCHRILCFQNNVQVSNK